ncbi:hypothetical protein E4P39_01670 [Blastococcus sp. CT_GayMR19]|uniref:hypothetical protein n=1 Tax=Blastococcus sp. CT_GayMR19 TaxID=2559608 RepID=UPI0010738E4F|nr:hypothetical protein [Blastococcus sp. CT_GayMR19]TFV79374.1 hypothetical protein E4P39_01670 [Blastococcus sp. CT_GayMR19]
MDLSRRLRAWALARPRVLIVDAPGTVERRWAVEAELDRRGWPLAMSPADTDVLLVLGTPGPQLALAIDVLWSQVAQPRHRVDLRATTDLHHRLEETLHALGAATPKEHVDGALPARAGAGHSPEGTDDSTHEGMEHSRHEGMDHSGHEGMDRAGMAGMDHSGHEGMDHSRQEGMDHTAMGGGGHAGHHMHHGGEVAGLPMAETAPDRDGLALDVLRVSIGPVLPGWPTGLLLRADLQGDVLTGAGLSWVDATDDGSSPPADVHPQRAALDQLASLLLVAGWPTAARDARCARDGLASTGQSELATARRRAARVARRVRRSRALAWTVRGAGHLPSERGSAGDGDVLDRVRRWCDVALGADGHVPASPASLDEVAAVLEGTELGTARLIVASVALDRSAANTEPEEARA